MVAHLQLQRNSYIRRPLVESQALFQISQLGRSSSTRTTTLHPVAVFSTPDTPEVKYQSKIIIQRDFSFIVKNEKKRTCDLSHPARLFNSLSSSSSHSLPSSPSFPRISIIKKIRCRIQPNHTNRPHQKHHSATIKTKIQTQKQTQTPQSASFGSKLKVLQMRC